jgi:FtsX-like permease family
MRGADVFGVAWYRFRCTWGERWPGYLALVLLLGLLGGLAMGSVAAARRTQAAFPAYLASTNPSDLTVLTGLYGAAGSKGYDPATIAKIAALPGVRHVSNYEGLNVAVLGPGQNQQEQAGSQGLNGSLDGEYFTTDRVTVVQGRMADPGKANEAVIDAQGTPSPVHVGSVAPLGFFTNAQVQAGRPAKPYLTEMMKVVGKVVYSSEETQDDADVQRDGGPLFTPALTRLLARCCADFTETSVQLAPGTSVAAAEASIQPVLPKGFPIEFYVTSLTAAKAQRAIEPTSIALAVFGAIAAVAALLIAGQVIGRQLRLGAGDLGTLRALGAGPAVTTGDGLPGIVGAIVVGALLAVAVAVGLSPLAPLGSIRAVYPYPGIAFDWTVLGAGFVLFTCLLAATAVVVAYRRAPHRALARGVPSRGAGSAVVRAAWASGLPAPAAEGVRLALDPRAERGRAPVRSAILGTVLATVVLLATVTFGASLTTLVSHPALYGWNWTYALSSGVITVNHSQATAVLDHDPEVAAWTGVWFGTAQIDGVTVPVLGTDTNAPVAPPLLSGHGLQGQGQVVLGAMTLAQLHKNVGDVVTVTDGGQRPFSARIVGTATLPSMGVAATLHTEMGTGAVLPYQDIPGAAGNEPNNILVTLRPGANLAAQQKVLQTIVPANVGGVVLPVQRPAEIADYQSMGTAPVILAGALVLGALSSLLLTLMSSVRRRRKDLALLKTLGFTRRQLSATVAWQSTAAITVGAIVGVPLGIALGRALWDLFAGQISVVPQPTVPALTVVLIVAGALVTANLVALLPGWVAGRTPAAALLRAELLVFVQFGQVGRARLGAEGLLDDRVIAGAEHAPVFAGLEDLLGAADRPEVQAGPDGGRLLALGQALGRRDQEVPHPADGLVGGAELLLGAVVDRAHRLGHHQVLADEVRDAAECGVPLHVPVDQVVVLGGVPARDDPVVVGGDRGRERGDREEVRAAEPPGVRPLLRREEVAPAVLVVDRDEHSLSGAERDAGDHGMERHREGGDPHVGVAVGGGADAGVAVPVPGVVDLEPRSAVVPPELPGHGVGRVAGLIRAVVGDVVDAVPLVQVGDVGGVDVAFHRLHPVAGRMLLGGYELAGVHPVGPEVPEGRHGLTRTQVGPDDAAGFVHRVSAHPDLLAERRRLARHVHAAAFGVEGPPVVDAADRLILVAAEIQRRPAVRAVLLHQPDPPGGVPEGNQVLPEQPDPGGRAARLGDLGGQAGRRPVPAQQVAHQRPGSHPSEDLVLFCPQHSVPPMRSPPQSYQFIY